MSISCLCSQLLLVKLLSEFCDIGCLHSSILIKGLAYSLISCGGFWVYWCMLYRNGNLCVVFVRSLFLLWFAYEVLIFLGKTTVTNLCQTKITNSVGTWVVCSFAGSSSKVDNVLCGLCLYKESLCLWSFGLQILGL